MSWRNINKIKVDAGVQVVCTGGAEILSVASGPGLGVVSDARFAVILNRAMEEAGKTENLIKEIQTQDQQAGSSTEGPPGDYVVDQILL